MKRSHVIVTVLLELILSFGCTSTRRAQTRVPTAPLNANNVVLQTVMRPVVYRIPGMDNVHVKSDLRYTTVAATPHLLMDAYMPPELAQGERRPAVLFIHGGVPTGAAAKNMRIFTSWGRLVAASGMVGITFTHRLGYPKPQLSEASVDVGAAIDYVRENADSLNVDRDRLCLAAYSGGGPMLSVALSEKPAHVRCLLAFYAFLDIQQSESHRAYESPELLRSFSPITYLTDASDIPPMFIARAGMDQTPSLNDSIDRFVREAISANVYVIVANHPDGVHGFDNQTDNDRSRAIIRAALTFMRTHLGVPEPNHYGTRGQPHAQAPEVDLGPRRHLKPSG